VSDKTTDPPADLRILAIVTGRYGRRNVANLQQQSPATWHIRDWQPTSTLPQVIDDPSEFVPDSLPGSDLILSFAETATVAQLIPEAAVVTGARAVIAGVDNEAWLPRGLARQLQSWLSEIGVACVTPKPWCSLTEESYGVRRGYQKSYDDSLIAAFARRFGQPDLRLSIDPATRLITGVDVHRDSVCGNTRFVAEQLIGVPVDDAERAAGLLHHHYPCLAGMEIDSDFSDTLMHVSGNSLKDGLADQIRPFKDIRFIVPNP